MDKVNNNLSQDEKSNPREFSGEEGTIDHKGSFMAKRAKIQLTFKNITVTASMKKRKCCNKKGAEAVELDDDNKVAAKENMGGNSKVILDNISGTVKSGEFLAILGASGAGKTTLLNYLSAKDISRNLRKSGEILVNGID